MVFGVLTSFGVSLCLGGLYFFGIAANEWSPNTPTRTLSALLLLPGLVIMVVGGFFFLFVSESKVEYRARARSIEYNERQSYLAQASNLAAAGRFEEAAVMYERYGMFGEAGRVRALKNVRDVRITGTVPSAPTIKETEIIREKEIITKIRCGYCSNLYDETLDKCPHCGAKR